MKELNENNPKSIHNSRLINASAEKIFTAFADPEHLKNWWGPKGFTNTFREYNFIKDGSWNFVMHGPDGKDYENKSAFRQIVKPEIIVIEHTIAPHFLLTITLKEEENKTRVNWDMLFETVEMRNNIAKYAVDANEENLDRLEVEVELIK